VDDPVAEHVRLTQPLSRRRPDDAAADRRDIDGDRE